MQLFLNDFRCLFPVRFSYAPAQLYVKDRIITTLLQIFAAVEVLDLAHNT